jgi:signal peptidase I
MRRLFNLAKTWALKLPCRLLLGSGLAALVGIAAGRTVLAVSGSVSVVDGISMSPTFPSGSRVYAAPIATELERGDIVLVDDGNKELAIKRIIGLPGETVHLWRGYVFVNRQMLREPYLPRFTYTFPDEKSEAFVFELGDEEYFVLGDNRPCSADSRVYGALPRKNIKSRVPAPEGMLRPEFLAYTLPLDGKRAIRPISVGNDVRSL